ncbi:fluoride efflux transporter CrcB [Phyllobacterium phragmitis]|uniref:Fluoride-specific ion channel FluC n=1 Tax=Phyllobacterium phragmitis TaxID=2670329 RepID=A0A2S9IRR7_9HYPH|nr:fluoride efflux transporter CrcB [Phyllobacterium phragmitis]PRD43208.1 fluoride efflux transporter CrcB [Phyllobacterium phragmitis]
MSLEACALVLSGGFIGGIARFFLSGLIGRRVGETFPWGTFVVNVTGALLIGAVAGLAQSSDGFFSGALFRDFLMVGLLGGYTTVSSFALQSLNLALGGQQRQALFNIAASAVLGVIAVGVGFAVVAWMLEPGR